MRTFFTKKGVKELLLSAVVLTMVLGPFQPLIAQADITAPLTNATDARTLTAQTNVGNDDFCVGGIGGCLANIIYVFTVGIGSTFAYVAAQFFNLTVNISLNGPIYALTFVSTGWTTARDLANMAFLFILIYIAFTIMLEADTHGTKELLAGVIAVALLVNFSFFFTRAVIDAGNILSIQFYNSITAPSLATTAASSGLINSTIANTVGYISTNSAGANTKDLTASIMGMLNLQGLLNNSSFQNFTKTQGWMIQFITLSFLYIAAAVMLWGLTVVFVTTGVKFLIRVVVLWFLIIASPLAFVAYTVPQFRKYFNDWRDMLISTAFYPVAFMFIFLILVNFCNQMSGSGESNLISNLFTNLSNNQANTSIVNIALSIANAAISLGFVITILYIGMKASDKISTVGADFAKSAGSWAGQGLLKSYNVGYKRVGPGAWSGALDKSLEKGVLSSKWVGNSALGYELRRYVTKPMAGTTIPGSHGESFVKMKERQGKEGKERLDNINNRAAYIKNRQDVRGLADINEAWEPLESQYNPLDKRIKELEGTMGPLTASQMSELATKKAQVSALKIKMDAIRPKRDQLLSNIEKIDGAQITALAGKDLEKIIKHISDKQIKAIKESLRYSATERANMEKKWHEEAKKAPLAESREQLNKLGELHKALGALRVNVAGLKQFDAYVKPAPGVKVNINVGVAKNITKELKDEMDKQEDIRDNRTLDATPAGKRERTIAGQAVKKLKQAIEKAEALEKYVTDIPQEVGGTKPEGQFIHPGK